MINFLFNLSLSDNSNKIDQLLKLLVAIREKFDKDLSFRCLATRIPEPNAYQIFMSYFKLVVPAEVCNDIILESFLKSFLSYINCQSDVLDNQGLSLFINMTNSSDDNETGFGSHINILKYLLKCLNGACLMNEPNRQYLVKNGLCENLMKIFLRHKINDGIISDACQLIRSLLLDDDIRVEFGNSHEHAKIIASKLNGIDILMGVSLSRSNFFCCCYLHLFPRTCLRTVP